MIEMQARHRHWLWSLAAAAFVDLGLAGSPTPAARMTYSMTAVVSGAGLKLPGRFPCAIINGDHSH